MTTFVRPAAGWRGYCSFAVGGLMWHPVAGWSIAMNRMLLTGDVREPDIDMRRVIARLKGGRVRRLLISVFGQSQRPDQISMPRRSVDREQQQYSPDYD